MPPLKKAPGVGTQAQSESTTMIQDKPDDVKMRSVEEIREEIARIEQMQKKELDKYSNFSQRLNIRLWALKWCLNEEV